MGRGIHISGGRQAARHIQLEGEIHGNIPVSIEVTVSMANIHHDQYVMSWLANMKQSSEMCAHCNREISTNRLEHNPLLCADCQETFEAGRCLMCQNGLPLRRIVDFHSFFCDPCQDARRQQKPP